MTNTAQELFELLKDAKPGPNYEPKQPPAPKLPAATRLYEPMVPSRVELPALGGSITLEYDDTPFLPRGTR